MLSKEEVIKKIKELTSKDKDKDTQTHSFR